MNPKYKTLQWRMSPRSIDNALYDRLSDSWWHNDGFLNLLKSTLNPWRLPYFQRTLQRLKIDPRQTCVLDVGCGGGLLAEEFAAMGFTVTGIDPSAPSIDIARAHAAKNNLRIDYRVAAGNALPFADQLFDVAICCDVLEHVREWDEVIREIARVVRPGGVLLFDTINRTFASKIRSIKLAQEWRWTRYAPPNTHVWAMFIKPDELAAACRRHGLNVEEFVGTAAKGSPLRAIRLIRAFRTRAISSAEFGRGINMTEGPVLSGSYMGHAVKA